MDDSLRGLGEKEAKEVLDFLARKVGYDELMFNESCRRHPLVYTQRTGGTM